MASKSTPSYLKMKNLNKPNGILFFSHLGRLFFWVRKIETDAVGEEVVWRVQGLGVEDRRKEDPDEEQERAPPNEQTYIFFVEERK